MNKVFRFSLFTVLAVSLTMSVVFSDSRVSFAWSAGDPVPTEISFDGEIDDRTFAEVAQSYFWEDPPVSMDGHTCTNRGMAFRLIQALAERQCPDGILRTYDLDFRLGWNFGCSDRLFGYYDTGIVDISGDAVSAGGVFRCLDYSTDASPVSCEPTPSSHYRIEAVSRSTGKAWSVALTENALSSDFFQVYDDWQELVYPKLISGDPLTEEEKDLDELMAVYSANLQSIVVSGNEGDFRSDTVTEGCGLSCYVEDGSLSYMASDDTVKTISLAESCMEGEGASRHACLCMAMAYRVAQITSEEWSDGVFRPGDVSVETGWNSDGAEVIFGDILGVESVNYGISGSVSSPGEMSLRDCWYRISIKSSGKSLVFRGTENMLSDEFLTLRRKVKGGVASDEDRRAFVTEMRDAYDAVAADPFYGGFEVRRIDTIESLSGVVPSSTLYYLSRSGDVTSMDLPSAALEDDGAGGTKICLCQSVAFRISQILSSLWADGVFRPEEISIETGWNTEGPVEFWVDKMGMSLGDVTISESATSGDRLSLSDCWYKATVKSTGEVYVFRGTRDLYVSDFLDLRALFKQGTATVAQKNRMKELRAETVDDVCKSPFVCRISVEEKDESGSSGCSISTLPVASFLLLAPLAIFRK